MKLRFILVLLLLRVVCVAQTTSVTLQVTDTDSQTWNNGTWSVQLTSNASNGPFAILGTSTPVPNQSQSGVLSASGGASMTLTPNASIGPLGTQWAFHVCPQAVPAACYDFKASVQGASQNLTLTPPGIRINVANPILIITAYQDLEIIGQVTGSSYYNLTTLIARQWNGSTWVNSGGGGTPPGGATLSVQYNNSGAFGGISVPTSPNGVPQVFTSTPSGGVGVLGTFALQGTVPRASVCTGNLDTILVTDRAGYVSENDASACAVTLPQAGTSGFANNFTFAIKNIGAGTVTITPTTSTIDGNATATLTTGNSLFIYSDNANYFSISPSGSLPDLIDTPGSVLTSTVPFSWSAGTVKSGNNPQWFRSSVSAICFAGQGDASDACVDDTVGWKLGTTLAFGWSSTGAATAALDTGLWKLAPNIVGSGNGTSATTDSNGMVIGTGGFGVSQLATVAISPLPSPVKADTANANQVVITTTTDTAAGIVIGVAVQSCGSAGVQCRFITTGIAALTLGTGSCAIGNFVIVDTTTNGRIKCTATYTAGTVIGVAMAAQASIGSTVNVMVGLR